MAPRLDIDREPPGLIPDLADDLADMLRRGRTIGGEAVARVIYVTVGGVETSVGLPVPRPASDPPGGTPESDSPADRVLAFLSGMRAGEWAKGRTIAAEIDLEYDGGQFKKLLAEMVQDDLLESSRANGYRLKRHNETP